MKKMSTNRPGPPRLKSLDCEEIMSARKRLRPTSPGRPPTSYTVSTGELQEARDRLRSPSAWGPRPETPSLIWHPQENYIGPAYAYQQHEDVSPASENWTSIISPTILDPSKLNINSINTYFSPSSSASSRPKTRASSPPKYSISSISLHDNRPQTRAGYVRDYSPNRDDFFHDYPIERSVSPQRRLNPSNTGDYGPLGRPITRGASPTRHVEYSTYQRPVTRGVSPSRAGNNGTLARPVTRGALQSRPKELVFVQKPRGAALSRDIGDFGTFQRPITRGASPSRPSDYNLSIRPITRGASPPRSFEYGLSVESISRGISPSKSSDFGGSLPRSILRGASPSRLSDFGSIPGPISRGSSPSRGVTLLYDKSSLSRLSSPDYEELMMRSRGPSPIPPVQTRGRTVTRGATRVSSPSPTSMYYPKSRGASPSYSRVASPTQKPMGLTPTPHYMLPTKSHGHSPVPSKSRGVSPAIKTRVSSPSPTRGEMPRGKSLPRPEKEELVPPRTPVTMPIMMAHPELSKSQSSVVRVAPPTVRSRIKSSAAFVVWHDPPPNLPPPRTPKIEPTPKKPVVKKPVPAAKSTKEPTKVPNNGVAAKGGAKKEDPKKVKKPVEKSPSPEEPPHVIERGDWENKEPVPGAIITKDPDDDIPSEDNFGIVKAPAGPLSQAESRTWSQRRGSTFSGAASTVGLVSGRMSSTRRRFFEAETTGASSSNPQTTLQKQPSRANITESTTKTGSNGATQSSSTVKNNNNGSSSNVAAKPDPKPESKKSSTASSASSVPSRGTSAIAAMASSSGSETPAMTMVSSTTVAGTTVTGIPTTMDIPTSATKTITSSNMTSTTTSSTNSASTVKAAPVSAAAVSSAMSSGMSSASTSVPMGSAGGGTYDTGSSSSSAVSSASSTGRFSALTSASARVRRLTTGSRSFKAGKHTVKEEDEEEEKEPPLSEEASKIKVLLLTEGLTGEDMASRLEDIMLLHQLNSSDTAAKIQEALESQNLNGGMLLKRMASVPAGAAMNVKEASTVFGQIMAAQSAKALAQFAEKAAEKAAKAQAAKAASMAASAAANAAASAAANTTASTTTSAAAGTTASTTGGSTPGTASTSASTAASVTPATDAMKRTDSKANMSTTSAEVHTTDTSTPPPKEEKSILGMFSRKSSMKQFDAANSAILQVSRLNSRRQSIQANAAAKQIMSAKNSAAEKSAEEAVKTAMKAAEEKAKVVTATAAASAADAVVTAKGAAKAMTAVSGKAGGMMTAGLGKAPDKSMLSGDGKKSPTSPASLTPSKHSSMDVKEVKPAESKMPPPAAPPDMTPTCCGSRSGWAKRWAAKSWPACCVKCCIRVPKPPRDRSKERIGCCRSLMNKLACCKCCKPNDIESGINRPAASLLPPRKPSLCARLCKALGCAKLSACCAAISCARCCRCCACCARCSPCCRKCCRGSAVSDVTPNPLDERRKSHPGIKSKRASRSLPGGTEVMPQVVRKLDPSLLDQNSVIQAAIPVLPLSLAWFCFICNIIVPGLGTIASGAFCLCVGMPRFTVEDRPENRLSTFILDIVVGVGQFFTVIFCLVGWGWSIWWGTIMIRLARKHKRLMARAAEELAKPPIAARRPSEVDKQKK